MFLKTLKPSKGSFLQGIYKIFHIKMIINLLTDLSRQTNMSIPQQINFLGKLEEDDDATMFFIAE